MIQEKESTESLVGALAHPRFKVIPVKGVEDQVRHLPPGATVTVTCSPVRGIEHTLQCAERLAERGLRVVPHISARLVVDEAHLRGIVRRLAALGLREIFVVGGDVKEPTGSFTGAVELLQALADLDHNLAEIGVTAYPERHPFIDHPTLRRALADKQRFATYMVTQICFDPDVIAQWLADVRREGIGSPVYIGLPGVIDRTKLLGISMKIGVGDSARFVFKHMTWRRGSSCPAAIAQPSWWRS